MKASVSAIPAFVAATCAVVSLVMVWIENVSQFCRSMRNVPIKTRTLIRLLPALAVLSPCASNCETPAPAGIEWALSDLQDQNGGWWKSFVIQSVPGVGYEIQTSTTLGEEWQTVESYYGSGGPIHHALFETTEPVEIDSDLPPPLPAAAIPAVFFIVEKNSIGNIILNWRSLDSGIPVRYLVAHSLDPVWEEFEGFHSHEHAGYFMTLIARVDSVSPDPAPGALSGADQAAVDAFLSSLPSITASIGDSIEAAMSNPPQAPDPNAKRFFRIRADWELDSDQDGRADWLEIVFDGNNPFNAYTAGAGLPDAQNINLPLAVSPPGPLQRPPVATIEHRHVVGGRIEQVIGFSTQVFGFAYNSNDYIWSEPSELEPFEDATAFGGVTGAVSGLAMPPLWKEGVVSLEAKNKEQEIGSTGLFDREWVNFKTEYRLKLSGPAPKGGYRIPLTFGRVHLKWDKDLYLWMPTAPPSGGGDALVLELVVPEGATESPAVPLPFLQPAANRAITLVPADITILEGAGAIPVDGLCVKTLETFQLDFNGTERDADDDLIPDEWLTWQSRQLKADGTFEGWSTFRQGNFGPEKTGNLVYVSKTTHGIFQVRAVLSPPGADPIYFPAVRMREATNPVDRLGSKNPLHEAGQPEYFGVVNDPTSLEIRKEAVSWLGSFQYALETNVKIAASLVPPQRNPSTTHSNKCNIFVAHVARAAGARVPYFTRWTFAIAAPLARQDWFSEPEENVDLDAFDWKDWGTTGHPFPGMIVATGASDSGHCAILDYDGGWIAAGPKSINKYDIMADPSQKYRTTRMRAFQPPIQE